jgi:hypothetical protein
MLRILCCIGLIIVRAKRAEHEGDSVVVDHCNGLLVLLYAYTPTNMLMP